MTSTNYFGILPQLTVYEDRLDGTDRRAYTVGGHDEALAFARVLVNNGSAVEIIPQSSAVPSVEEFAEIDETFGEDENSTKGPNCQCDDPNCPCKDPVADDEFGSEYETAQVLSNTTDSLIWAQEFIRVQSAYECDPTDLGWVIGWFANAIEAGRTAGQRSQYHYESKRALQEDELPSNVRDEDRHQGLSDPLG